MGGHSLPKIPNYRIYKAEKVPELAQIQERLAAHGLKDPWIRNEVWRWHPEYGTVKSRTIMFWTRGMAVGAVLGFLTYGFQQWYTARHPEFYHWKDPDFPHQHADNGHGGHH